MVKPTFVQVGGVAALSVRGNFMFDAATHRDFLGACLGTGVDRSKMGDVLITGEQGAHVLVVPELAEYLTTHLTSVRPLPAEPYTLKPQTLDTQTPDSGHVSVVEKAEYRTGQHNPRNLFGTQAIQ